MQRKMQQPGGAASAPQAPNASPMPAPADKQGLKAKAMSNLSIAQNMIEQALTAFEPEDKEYKACLKVLNLLEPLASRNDGSDLVPAEVMRMVGQLPQMGGGTQMQRQIMQQLHQQQQPQPQQQPAPGGA